MIDRLKNQLSRGIFGTGWKNALFDLVLAAAVYGANEIYPLLNHGPARMILRTPLDNALPVVPVFVVPYDSLYLLIYGTLILLLLFRTRIFQTACLALVTVLLISFGIYYVAQTEVFRPVISGSDIFSRMVRDVYAGDQPFNDFPSLHNSTSTLMAIFWYRTDKRIGIVVAVWTLLIIASTVLIKQHYLADLVGGILLAFGVAFLWMRVMLRRA